MKCAVTLRPRPLARELLPPGKSAGSAPLFSPPLCHYLQSRPCDRLVYVVDDACHERVVGDMAKLDAVLVAFTVD